MTSKSLKSYKFFKSLKWKSFWNVVILWNNRNWMEVFFFFKIINDAWNQLFGGTCKVGAQILSLDNSYYSSLLLIVLIQSVMKFCWCHKLFNIIKLLFIILQEFIIHKWLDESSIFHNTLVNKYCEKILSLLNEYKDSLPEGKLN